MTLVPFPPLALMIGGLCPWLTCMGLVFSLMLPDTNLAIQPLHFIYIDFV